MDEESIFCQALEHTTAEARAAFLDQACAGDEDLRCRVDALIRLREDHESFLAEPAALGGPCVPEVPVDASGALIGRYRLLQRIGEGGFGTVYMADQTEPVRRRVALKVIKAGMDTRQVIARFEAERQALAMMDHPNIARVLDAGATEAQSPLGPGRPYFVMELVKGRPITRFCDEERLDLRERLMLFVDACHAVQHAHQKGVIHRDLKPSNVLVSRCDDRPVVKIIDFGIAKATGSNGARLTDKTLFTEFRQLIGTPAYMSPEQAGLSDLDIDTRSDIYSLGVLLYELVAGSPPFDAARLLTAGFDEMRRIIQEEEAPRPSTRVEMLPRTPRSGAVHAGSSAPLADATEDSQLSSAIEVTSCRGTDLRSLVRSLRGDLDWVAMKALEKDRTRRYDTAADLAEDVERYLNHEAVSAGPPRRVYRLRKFVRRNRAVVLGTTLVAAALLVGLAGTTVGLVRAEQRRMEAEAAHEQTKQVSDFQSHMLSGIDAMAMGLSIEKRYREQVRAALERQYVGQGRDRRKRTPEEIEAAMEAFDESARVAQATDVARGVLDEFVLARAASTLETRFVEQPLVQAQLGVALGRAYAGLGLNAAAESQLRKALELRQRHYGAGVAHAEVAWCHYNLAQVIEAQGRLPEAEEKYLEALSMSRELSDQAEVARTLQALANMFVNQRRTLVAEQAIDEALPIIGELYGEDSEELMFYLGTRAALYWKQGRLPLAEKTYRRILEWRQEHRVAGKDVANTLANLAQMVGAQQRHGEAVEYYDRALELYRAAHGEDHALVAKTRRNLGNQLEALGQYPEAEEQFRRALDVQRRLLGVHPDVRNTLVDLADSRARDRDWEKEVALLWEALDIADQIYPPGSPEAFRRFSTMMRLWVALGNQAGALRHTDRERTLALMEEAEPLGWAGFKGLEGAPLQNLEKKRRSVESAISMLGLWHKFAPDAGWDARADKWRAELEKIPENK